MSFPTFGPDRFGLPEHGAHTPHASELHSIPTPSVDMVDGALTVHNPLLAFGLLGLIWAGAAAFATTVRVGPVQAGVAIGDSK